MDMLITIIGLTSFVYLFVLGVKVLKEKARRRAGTPSRVKRTIRAKMQVRLCEYGGMPCRIFCSTEHNFTHIYAPKRFSQETAEAIMGQERDLMTENIYFYTRAREEYYGPSFTLGSIDTPAPYARFLRLHDGEYMNIWGFDS